MPEFSRSFRAFRCCLINANQNINTHTKTAYFHGLEKTKARQYLLHVSHLSTKTKSDVSDSLGAYQCSLANAITNTHTNTSLLSAKTTSVFSYSFGAYQCCLTNANTKTHTHTHDHSLLSRAGTDESTLAFLHASHLSAKTNSDFSYSFRAYQCCLTNANTNTHTHTNTVYFHGLEKTKAR